MNQVAAVILTRLLFPSSFPDLRTQDHIDLSKAPNFLTSTAPIVAMTSDKLQIYSFGLIWLLTTVYIVRVAPMPSITGKRSSFTTFSLILQRPLFAGGLLRIPLNNTVQLIQCSTKDVAQNIIRLQYGSKRKNLTMRTNNAVERKQWITTIERFLVIHSEASTTHHTSRTKALTPLRRSSRTASNCPAIAQRHRQITRKTMDPKLSECARPQHSLDAIKRLADGYDSLAQQWSQVATETRQFNTEISSLQLLRIGSEHPAVGCFTC